MGASHHFHGDVLGGALQDPTATWEGGVVRQGALQTLGEASSPARDHHDVDPHPKAQTVLGELLWPGHILAPSASHHQNHLGATRYQRRPLLLSEGSDRRTEKGIPDRIACEEGALIAHGGQRAQGGVGVERRTHKEAGVGWGRSYPTEDLSHLEVHVRRDVQHGQIPKVLRHLENRQQVHVVHSDYQVRPLLQEHGSDRVLLPRVASGRRASRDVLAH
mmetsp:Transcript_123682/g.263687  ORF Transcript_123682/g.263687 Transcript_123682/m.263687 type:complete len:219 (-) Transcript_123682:41-697(-)